MYKTLAKKTIALLKNSVSDTRINLNLPKVGNINHKDLPKISSPRGAFYGQSSFSKNIDLSVHVI